MSWYPSPNASPNACSFTDAAAQMFLDYMLFMQTYGPQLASALGDGIS